MENLNYFLMDDWGGVTPIFGLTPIWIILDLSPHTRMQSPVANKGIIIYLARNSRTEKNASNVILVVTIACM